MTIEQFYQQGHYHKINGFRIESVIKMIGQRPNQVILDIGCSIGLLGQEVKKRLACQFYGADLSAPAVAAAKNVLDDAWVLNLENDLSNWPQELKAKAYDAIVISEVLEHLFEPENLLVKLKGLAMPAKSIIITVPNILFWKNRLKILVGHFDYTNQGIMDRGHIHFFSWASFNKMIEEAGYQIMAVDNHLPTRGTKWLGKIWPGLFSFQFVVKIKTK